VKPNPEQSEYSRHAKSAFRFASQRYSRKIVTRHDVRLETTLGRFLNFGYVPRVSLTLESYSGGISEKAKLKSKPCFLRIA